MGSFRNIVGGCIHAIFFLGWAGGCQTAPSAPSKISASQNVESHIQSARTCIQNGQFDLAESELTLARKLGAENGQAYYLTGILFQRLNQPELAFEYYQQAVAKSPAEPDFLLAEAKMLVAMGRTPEAIEILNSKSSDFRTSTTFCDTLGQLLMQSQEYSQAEELFRQASNLSKGDRQIARRFAMALYANRHYPECVIVLSKLIARQSVADRPSLLVMLGYSLDQLGRHPEAAKCYQLALTINPDDPMTTQWIASIDLDDLKD